MDISNKTVVVTGAGRGIGRAIALKLARHGADIALFDLNADDLAETSALCAAQSVQARGYRVNVADEGEVSAAMTRVAADFGRLDGLVNNAGIVRDGLLVKVKDGEVVGRMTMDQWNAVIGVNLSGVFLCAREAAAHMIEFGNGGVIVNISSISRAGNAGQSNYSAAKAGLNPWGWSGRRNSRATESASVHSARLHSYRDPLLDASGSAGQADGAGAAKAPGATRGNRSRRAVHIRERFLYRPLPRRGRRFAPMRAAARSPGRAHHKYDCSPVHSRNRRRQQTIRWSVEIDCVEPGSRHSQPRHHHRLNRFGFVFEYRAIQAGACVSMREPMHQFVPERQQFLFRS